MPADVRLSRRVGRALYPSRIGWTILIRTYWKDVRWLALCLASLEAHARGFEETVVVLPRRSLQWLRRIGPLPAGVRVESCDDYGDDYLGQQVTKLHADEYTDADVVCHFDVDCLLHAPLSPDALSDDGAPVVVTREARALGRHWPWGKAAAEFLGWPLDRDYMQRPPFSYPRGLYAEVRRHAEARHGVPVVDYVLSRPPRGFSEFNALGAFARARHPDWLAFVDASEGLDADWPCAWYSTWTGVESVPEAVRRRLPLDATDRADAR